MDLATGVHILDEFDCISQSINTIEKGYESSYSPSSYG